MTLTDIELRVLSVLIEKSLTQAGSYPLTMNSLVLGCNQKQNRDPVVEYAEGDVARAVHTLQVKGLIKEAAPAHGARVNRFAHCVLDIFKWDRRQQAVMGELMLRGRQTAGELRTHASRMTPFADLHAVNVVLDELKRGERVFVEELPREPGRSANRFRHLLAEEGVRTSSGPIPRPDTRVEERVAPSVVVAEPGKEDRIRELEARLSVLEARVERLARVLEGAQAESFADGPQA
jgi:hypothetical protein